MSILYYIHLFKDQKRNQFFAPCKGVTLVPSVGAAAAAATLVSVMTRQRRNGSRFACALWRKPRNPVTVGTITPLSKVAVAAPEDKVDTTNRIEALKNYIFFKYVKY